MKIFKEEQRFTQWWLWILLITINGLFLYGTYQQLFLKIPYGDNPMPNSMLIITTLVLLCFTSFFYFTKLETRIDEHGIHYRFYPINLNYKKIPWKDINEVNVIKYRPITDYGGWGIKGNAVNVKGNIGIKIYTKDNKNKLIGTQKENEARSVLETYKLKKQ
ncbi:DUF6141 family protein [Tenacibaculum tangerinum]|uniref:DUF6141 family protein n=1 Tax=Tenacibaculum tangerinum TaxID=3038772 RepID=A0ABY8L9V9_9FLAO|nr:DUF6141 family protein [Tenacibaculum tangerinum]WGH76805.1 DUF6141 family protein [Tenacibaculum tangerinum]